jgi:hypothetical protein
VPRYCTASPEKHTGGASNLIGDGKARPWCALGRRTKGLVADATAACPCNFGLGGPRTAGRRITPPAPSLTRWRGIKHRGFLKGRGIEWTFRLPLISRAYATFTNSLPKFLPWSRNPLRVASGARGRMCDPVGCRKPEWRPNQGRTWWTRIAERF